MKQSAILINTSRGAVANESELYEALSAGVIAGAGLDVFEKEPADKNNPLLTLRNVMLLPHVASHSCESQLEAGLMACRNVIAFIEGRQPESLLNPEYKKYVN
jgi:glyoxylate reductase